MKPVVKGAAIAGFTTSLINDDTTSTVLGVNGTNAYNVLNTIKDKEYFSTEEVMVLLQLSKPTVLRKFKEWQSNPYSKEGIAYEGQVGRGGFRVSKSEIEKYADSHGITLNWQKLATTQIEKQAEESVKATGISREKQTLHKIELDKILLQKAQLEIEYLELEADDEQDPAKVKELRKKILEAKMRVKNIEYDIKVLEFSLDKDSEK